MTKILTHQEADKEVQSAMGNPSGQAMNAFQSFLSNRGTNNIPQLPNIPKDQIRKLPLRAL